MVKCCIVDDERMASELLYDLVQKLYPEIEIVGVCNTWTKALTVLRNNDVDILFMDISMPEKSGIDVLSMLPTIEAEVIFVTAYTEFAYSAFKFQPAGYVVKPVEDGELKVAVEKALKRIYAKKGYETKTELDNRIGIPNVKGVEYKNISDIIYLEAQNSSTKIITKTETVFSAYPLAKYKQQLETYPFFQISRSYLVNLNCIVKYLHTGNVVTTNGHELAVSKSSKDELLALLDNDLISD